MLVLVRDLRAYAWVAVLTLEITANYVANISVMKEHGALADKNVDTALTVLIAKVGFVQVVIDAHIVMTLSGVKLAVFVKIVAI